METLKKACRSVDDIAKTANLSDGMPVVGYDGAFWATQVWLQVHTSLVLDL